MTNLYQSKWSGLPETEADLAPVAAPRKSGWTRKRKMVVGGIAAAALIIPGAAYAAVQIFGFGQFSSDAAVTQNLTVDNSTAQLTASLVPGQTVGAKANVSNPNDFPITVTGIILQNSSLVVTPKAPAQAGDQANCETTVHAVGDTTGVTYPGSGGGAGTKQAIAANVVIPAHDTKTVTVPQAVKQDATATALCGVKANFAVVAQTAS